MTGKSAYGFGLGDKDFRRALAAQSIVLDMGGTSPKGSMTHLPSSRPAWQEATVSCKILQSWQVAGLPQLLQHEDAT